MPRLYNFSCSTQLSTKVIMLINVKMLTIVCILTFFSMIHTLGVCKMQGCGNIKIIHLSRDKLRAIMYLSKEKCTCPKEQISLHLCLHLSVLKQFTLSKQYTTRYHLSCKQCRSRSAGFFKGQLIWIHTVFNATCELVIINQNMKYNGQNCIYLIHLYLSKDKCVNRKFQLVLNENVPVGQFWHGSSTAMLDESTTFITVGLGRPHI